MQKLTAHHEGWRLTNDAGETLSQATTKTEIHTEGRRLAKEMATPEEPVLLEIHTLAGEIDESKVYRFKPEKATTAAEPPPAKKAK